MGAGAPWRGPPSHLKASWAASRKRLFNLLEELVKWENTTNEPLLAKARAEIRKSWRETCDLNKDHPRAAELFDPDKLPAFHDPFAGGGALPLEAQRLGLDAYASDLNSVAVLISKAMIEIPPRFAGRPPVHPRGAGVSPALLPTEWKGAQGLAEDVRYYGQWMRDEAQRRIGHLYPPVEITAEMAWGAGVSPARDGQDGRPPAMDALRPDLVPLIGQKLTVIAWLWARTVKSPNPAFRHLDVPLASTFILSSKAGKEAYVEPVIEGAASIGGPASCPPEPEPAGETPAPLGYRFTVRVGKPPVEAKEGTKLSRGANFRCLVSGTSIEPAYIYAEANAGRMGARLMGIVAEGARGRVYLAPSAEHEAVSQEAKPDWKPEIGMPENPRWFSPPLYGLKTYGDLFTPRQLVAVTTFSDLVTEAREKIRQDAIAAGMPDADTPPHNRGAGVPPASETNGGQDGHPAPPGWYRRGAKHPPHYDAANLTQFVTFRLADSLPQEKLRQWKEDLAAGRIDDGDYRARMEDWLDRGIGTCWLRDPAVAELVQEALLHFDGERYDLHGWVIMPNHVHVVFSPREPHRLAEILHTWKSFTAKQANRLLGRTGAFWQDDYFDRFIRDEADFGNTLTYVAYNPVTAGLCATPEEYPFAGGPASQGGRPPPESGRYPLAR